MDCVVDQVHVAWKNLDSRPARKKEVLEASEWRNLGHRKQRLQIVNSERVELIQATM